MKLVRLKHGVALIANKDRGLKLEWGRLGWFGAAFRRDLRGFTLNFFFYFNFHLSFAYSQERPDVEVKTYGGMIVPRDQMAIWQWAWTGGGSEVSDRGLFKQFLYGDFLLGEPVFTESVVTDVKDWPFEMPEGPYWLDVKISQGAWKRPRSPFTRRLYRAVITVSDGGEIPVPLQGGEETGTYGETRQGLKTKSLKRILRAYRRDLIEERRFVAGDADWRPKNAEISKS